MQRYGKNTIFHSLYEKNSYLCAQKKVMLANHIILGMIGGYQLAIIVAIALLFFGGKKIPELMRGLGGGIREFKDAMKDEKEQPERLEKLEKVEEQKKLEESNS